MNTSAGPNQMHEIQENPNNRITIEDIIILEEREEEVFRRRESLSRTPPKKKSRDRANSLPNVMTGVKRGREEDGENDEAIHLSRVIEKLSKTSKELYRLTEKNVTTKVEIKQGAKSLYWQIEEMCRSYKLLSTALKWNGKPDTEEIAVQTDNTGNQGTDNEDLSCKIEDAIQNSVDFNKIAVVLDAKWPADKYRKTSYATTELNYLNAKENYAVLSDTKADLGPMGKKLINGFPGFGDLITGTDKDVEYLLRTTHVQTSKGIKVETTSAAYMVPVSIDKNGVNDMEVVHNMLRKLAEVISIVNATPSLNLIIGEGLDSKYVRKMCEQVFAKRDVVIKIHTKKVEKKKQKKKKSKNVMPREKPYVVTGKEAATTVQEETNKTGNRTEEPEKADHPRKQKKRGEAILIKTNGGSYAETLKRIKRNIDPDKIGITIKGIRKTKAGEMLLELGKGSNKSNDLKTALEGVADTGMSVKILNEDNKRATLVVKDIEDGVSAEEIIEALRKSTDTDDAETMSVTSLKSTYSNTQVAIVVTTERIANKLVSQASGRVRIGWVSCRVRRWVEVVQCYKCYKYGHISHECKGEDLSSLCVNCGGKDHKKVNCQNQSKCICCGKTGHRSGTAACRDHRKALEKARKKQNSR